MNSLGARSDWTGKVDVRVLPPTVTLIDDPSAKDYKGTPLIGSYTIDEQGVPAEKVTIVEDGKLKNLLMSRQPGPDSDKSNGHGRSAFIGTQAHDEQSFLHVPRRLFRRKK